MFLNPVIGNKEIITSSGSDLKVHSLSTGEALHSLKNHSGRITCSQLVPGNKMQVMTASAEDNAIVWWDYVDGVKLSEKKLVDEGEKIVKFVALDKTTIFAQIVPKPETSINPKLWRIVELKVQPDSEYLKKTTTIRKTRGYSLSGFATGGPEGRLLVIASGRTLVWYNTKTREVVKKMTKEIITTCAVHPSQECVATGEKNGQISIWRRNTYSTLHWHAHAVSALTFTVDGTYLLSGGEEAVLVLWQLAISKNTFIARLGAPIEAIATNSDATRYAVATKNNSIWVIDGRSMQKDFQIRGLATQTSEHKNWLKNLVYDPRSQSVVVKSDSGTLQFYDIFRGRHVLSLDVVKRNYVSKTEDEETTTWTVERIALKRKRLATFEKLRSRMVIKFWKWVDNRYEMNTIINQPHEKRILSMNFNDSATLLVTTSLDGKFKLWEINPDSSNEQWQCKSVAFYRDSPLRDAKFSQDGSLLAAASNRTLTLWNPYTNSLLDRLTHPCLDDTVSQLEIFSQYLLGTLIKGKKLYMWDLLQKKVLWSLSGAFLHITSHQQYFIVAERKHILIFFHTDPTPQTVIPVAQQPMGLTFCPIRHVPIYSIFTGEILAAFEDESASSNTKIDEEEEETLPKFTGILSKIKESRKRKLPQETTKATLDKRSLAVSRSKELLETLSSYSSHVLPPVSKLFEAFFEDHTAQEGTKLLEETPNNQIEPEQNTEKIISLNGVDSPEKQYSAGALNSERDAAKTDMQTFFAKKFKSTLGTPR
eukprot:CAMPEP_0184007832 /NCGR_PEP_ID=MMETSP0954-20121128/1588_1 /TAXON_ID=627963 /ORGANISM="Aplanochytrium sp, Strain PBS07" /LENGTH=762 /DNA_ID=CAMNT_0026286777 /DNA_START=91 /DNA_END=2376 /DNA_ORIENTATION=-